MKTNKIVATYYGVNIIQSCGYYYPEVNGNIECTSIRQVKLWIKNVWCFVRSNIYTLADTLELPRGLVWDQFISLNH